MAYPNGSNAVCVQQTSGCLISCTYEWPSGKEAEYIPRKMLARIMRSHCHFRGKIDRMERYYQGGKDAVCRCGK